MGTSGRPPTKRLVDACAEASRSEVLTEAWDDEKNRRLGFDLETVSFQSHTRKAWWRCPKCRNEFDRTIANWVNRPPYCEQCQREAAGEKRRKDTISVCAAEGERASAIMVAQWDADNPDRPEEVTPREPEGRRWRCGGCDYSWVLSPRNRWAGIKGKLARIARDADIDEPDIEFACPRCCGRPGTSSVELAVALELQALYPCARAGFLAAVRIDLGPGEIAYRPDVDLGPGAPFLEYDGLQYHKDKAEKDESRTKLIERVTGRKVLRVRERTRKEHLPKIDAWTLEVDADSAIPAKVGLILHEIAGTGAPPPGGLAAVEGYRAAGTWLTRDRAREERRLLAGNRTDPTARVRRLGEEGLLQEYRISGFDWTRTAKAIGFKDISGLSSIVDREFATRLVDLAASVGLPAHAPTLKRGALESGKFDHLLGVRSDNEVARLAGVSKQAVAEYRANRGIPRTAPKVSKLAAFHSDLGRVPDAEIARRAGCTASNVKQYRARLGIPAPGAGPRREPV